MPLELFNLNNINNLYSSNRGGLDFSRHSGWIMVAIIGTDSVYPVMVHIQSYAFAEGRRTQDWRVGAGKTPVCHGRQGKTSRLRLKGLPWAAAS